MESSQFDDLTRVLGANRSRRSAVKLLGAAALGVLGASRLTGSATAKAAKVGICHVGDDGSVSYISVSENAVKAHAKHGDVIDPDFAGDPANCGGCGNVCHAATQTCAAGTCVERCAGVDCSAQTTQCTAGVCDPATGSCAAQPANVGMACDTDGLVCLTQTCQTDGTCGGSTPLACPDTGNECLFANGCQEPDGCVVIPLDGAFCTTASGVVGTCVAGACTPNVCPDAVLAGAGGSTEGFLVDDDLEVLVNGVPVYIENDEFPSFLSPIALGPLVNGDTVRLVASNSTEGPFCTVGFEFLDSIILYCPSTGMSQVILPFEINQGAGGCGHVFFDQTVQVALWARSP